MQALQATHCRFVPLERVAAGSSGTVYKARDLGTGRLVALKIMRTPLDPSADEYSEDLFTSLDRTNVSLARSDGLHRFRREALILAHVDHPGIVRFIEHGVLRSGQLYLAMSWLEGETLAHRLARGPISVRETAMLAMRLGAALGHVHKLGIVHRDIKPSNLFLSNGELDKPVLIDFGVARGYPETEPGTDEGLFLGTVGYVAPEQARGDHDIDACADVFALGCVLFKCLTGRLPFEGNSLVAVLGNILLKGAPAADELVPDLPPRIVDLVARMLSKDRSERPANGYAVAQEFQALLLELDCGKSQIALRRPRLSGDEQRVASILAIATTDDAALSVSGMRAIAQTDDGSIATALERTDADLLKAIRSAARPFGAAVRQLVDGTFVAMPEESGTAIEQATQAARLAVALQGVSGIHSVAIATGSALFVGRSPVGDAVERAVDLLGDATRESSSSHCILLDADTAELLDGRFHLDRARDGWILRREISEAADIEECPPSGDAYCSPMFGRDRELAVLLGAFAECREESIPKVVVLNGEAGIGKSRLAAEFIAAARGRDELIEVWRDRPPELRELDAIHVAEIRHAWLRFLEAKTRHHPVILVLDHLHGRDATSSALAIDWTLGQLRERPLFVLAMTQPGARALSGNLWANRNPLELGLCPLRRRTCVQLVRSVLGANAGEDLVERLAVRSRGNPFCLTELIRAERMGRGDTLPVSIQAMMQARIRERSVESRRLLRAASLFGRVFWREGLLALLGAGEAGGAGDDTHAVDSSLAELADADLIHSRSDSRFARTSEYAFQSELVQQAAYSSLTERDRVVGREIAAAWRARRSN